MTIFQKIAASSFAAVYRTLRRRLIALTIQEGLMHDGHLDIDARDAALKEAKVLIRQEFGIADGRMGNVEVEGLLAEFKRRLLKKMSEEELAEASSDSASEASMAGAEDALAMSVETALPEERQRIRQLLDRFPSHTETKVETLLTALGTLWRQDPKERVVIFATYLGSVEMLGQAIAQAYPSQGVVVLKGGDHGSKAAAEKRFKQAGGPRVMICTAAGREGINLQHARILFNFDLPWNPMDLEQRIGRIHRYGQRHTAQVYNLVLSDTIEGKIFLLLDDKLKEIAKAVGKVDEHGEVAEDLRSQILGQLSERLNYENLYAQALGDPELKRTRLELEAAVSNASEARQVVFELFQDLDRFSLEDYQPLADVEEGMSRLVCFMRAAASLTGSEWQAIGPDRFRFTEGELLAECVEFTVSREDAQENAQIGLLGLDHPVVDSLLRHYRALDAADVGIRVDSPDERSGFVSLWHVVAQGEHGETRTHVVPLALGSDGKRIPSWERSLDQVFDAPPSSAPRKSLGSEELVLFDEALHRELRHRRLVSDKCSYSSRLIGWIEIMGAGSHNT